MCFKDLGSDPSITEIKEATVKEATVKGEENKSAHNRPIWQQNLVKFFKHLHTNALSLSFTNTLTKCYVLLSQYYHTFHCAIFWAAVETMLLQCY